MNTKNLSNLDMNEFGVVQCKCGMKKYTAATGDETISMLHHLDIISRCCKSPDYDFIEYLEW